MKEEEIPTSTTHVERWAGLDDLAAFYWKVEAVDWYGSTTSSHETEASNPLAQGKRKFGFITLEDKNASFSTDNTNGFPGFIRGRAVWCQHLSNVLSTSADL